jgi:hypothetical protein
MQLIFAAIRAIWSFVISGPHISNSFTIETNEDLSELLRTKFQQLVERQMFNQVKNIRDTESYETLIPQLQNTLKFSWK